MEAFWASPQGSAYAEFQEHRKGTLRAGYRADFPVLSTDPTDLKQLAKARVLRTVVGGPGLRVGAPRLGQLA